MTELDDALNRLKNGKSKDDFGIVAEMLKNGGDVLKRTLLELYNEISKPMSRTPDQWKQSTIAVLFKSGDPQLPNNYRPITIIPLLYKLFARLLYNRLEPILDPQQSQDQAGFRRNFNTDDHLFTAAMIQETAREWQIPVWACTLDFKKAFDTVSHEAIWSSLQQQNVPKCYTHLLQQLYANQTGKVRTDVTSRIFNI